MTKSARPIKNQKHTRLYFFGRRVALIVQPRCPCATKGVVNCVSLMNDPHFLSLTSNLSLVTHLAVIIGVLGFAVTPQFIRQNPRSNSERFFVLAENRPIIVTEVLVRKPEAK